MVTRRFKWAALLLCTVSAWAGDSVRNGGGLAEQNVMNAWVNIERYIYTCLESKRICELTIPEEKLLYDIKTAVRFKEEGGGIQFKSGRENPGFFQLDEQGQARTAVTGDDVGDVIYINLDRLYPTVEGREQPLTVLEAVALLVHELGHHQRANDRPIRDHGYLSQLGEKVRRAGMQFNRTITLSRYNQEKFSVQVQSLARSVYDLVFPTKADAPKFAELSFGNGWETEWLGTPFGRSLPCRPSSGVGEFAPVASHFDNLSWKRLAPFDATAQAQTLEFESAIEWGCRTPQAVFESDVFIAEMTVKALFEVREIDEAGHYVAPWAADVAQWMLYPKIFLLRKKGSLQYKIENCQRFGREGDDPMDCEIPNLAAWRAMPEE